MLSKVWFDQLYSLCSLIILNNLKFYKNFKISKFDFLISRKRRRATRLLQKARRKVPAFGHSTPNPTRVPLERRRAIRRGSRPLLEASLEKRRSAPLQRARIEPLQRREEAQANRVGDVGIRERSIVRTRSLRRRRRQGGERAANDATLGLLLPGAAFRLCRRSNKSARLYKQGDWAHANACRALYDQG